MEAKQVTSNLNGVELIGSVVCVDGYHYIIKNAYTVNNDTYYLYDITECINDFWNTVPKEKLQFVTVKTPPKKYIERLNKIDEKIKIFRSKMDEEIENIIKDRGLDESAKCDDEIGMVIDDMSYNLGLDDLYDEYDLLLNKMAQQAIEVWQIKLYQSYYL